MEQQQRSLVFTAAVGLIILAIIVGSIYYLVKFIQGRVSNSKQTAQVEEQVASGSANIGGSFEPQTINFSSTAPQSGTSSNPSQPGTSANTQNPPSGKKVYKADDFQLAYPNNWGVLRCSNSQNFEFDPQSPTDSSLSCDLATKPITVVVADIRGCQGEASKVGNLDVVKSQASEDGYTKYQWCTKTTPVLNITHRVSQNGETATSKQDFSKQVEDIIANLSFTRGS